MVNNEVNTVVLSKSSYDNMRGTNDRASMQQRKIVNPYVTAEDWRKIMEAPKMKWKLLDGKISIYRVCDVIRCDIKRDETIRKVVKR
jgi:hypothetical protein